MGIIEYVSALKSSDPRPAYDMLTDKEQKTISYEQWATDWKRHKEERLKQAKELETTLETHGIVDSAAVLRFDDGKRVTLQHEAAGWRLDQALVNRTVANTPDDAIAIFSQVLQERNVEALLRIVSKRHREGIQKQLQRFHESLKGELAKPHHEIFLVNPNRAEITWSNDDLRYRLVLVKEDGDWFIDDIHLGPDPGYNKPDDEEEEP